MPSTIWSGSKTFTVPSATETVVAISAPARGTLRGYTLVQSAGTAAGFTAALYTSDKVPDDVYHLLTATAAASATVAENTALDIAYQNRNGTPSLHERLLYLKITPAGTGDKTFTMSVTVATPLL
jgi:uncharacterized iron-regulated membrane protein